MEIELLHLYKDVGRLLVAGKILKKEISEMH